MSTSKRRRSLIRRPGHEALEARQLLSGVVHGVDVDGDTWTLSLIGPGAIQVINQPGSDGTTPVPLGQPGLINTITLQGTNPARTRLVGAVTKSATGDGKVFFDNLSDLTTIDLTSSRVDLPGMLAVDMPDFWLGDTNPSADQSNAAAGLDLVPQRGRDAPVRRHRHDGDLRRHARRIRTTNRTASPSRSACRVGSARASSSIGSSRPTRRLHPPTAPRRRRRTPRRSPWPAA